MKTVFTDLDIHFHLENTDFSALNIVFETFEQPIPQHSHGSSSYEIHYIPYGRGQAIIDNVSYDVAPNTVYITGPHVEHAQIPDKTDPMSEYCIYLKIKHNHYRESSTFRTSYISLFKDTAFWFGQDTQDLHPLMQQIFHELEYEYIGYMTQVEALLSQCVVKMIRNYKHRSESKKHIATPNLVDSKYIILEESFLYEYHNITLEKLAARLRLSPRQTERFIKDYYGRTFSQKKTDAKMAAATMKLADSKITITEIAYTLGYSSVEHFSHAFKKYYGITARQYRKEHKETLFTSTKN